MKPQENCDTARFKIIDYEVLESTNDKAIEICRKEEIADNKVIVAHYQTNGKGQKGNKWESRDSENLTFSIITHPTFIEPQNQFLLNMAVSLSIKDYIQSLEILGVKIKWPNDIYVNDSKIAGVLIENFIMGRSINDSIIGIGLNINQTKFSDDIPNPVSLKSITGKSYNLADCLDSFLVFFCKRYDSIINGSNDIFSDYMKSLYRMGEKRNYKYNDEIFAGTIVGVTEYGLIKIQKESGEVQEFDFKEIQYII